jgi:hypothetical protein
MRITVSAMITPGSKEYKNNAMKLRNKTIASMMFKNELKYCLGEAAIRIRTSAASKRAANTSRTAYQAFQKKKNPKTQKTTQKRKEKNLPGVSPPLIDDERR